MVVGVGESVVFTDTTMTRDTPTVYVIRGTNKHKTSYHDGENACQSSKAADQFEQMSKAEAEGRGLEKCKWCADEVDIAGADFSYQQALKQAAKANAGDN